MGGKELLVDPWTQRLSILRGPCLVDHVVHVVENMEVGVLSEMIRWPFSWVPGLGETEFLDMDHVAWTSITWYEMHLQDLSGRSLGRLLQQTMHASNHQEQRSVGKVTKSQWDTACIHHTSDQCFEGSTW